MNNLKYLLDAFAVYLLLIENHNTLNGSFCVLLKLITNGTWCGGNIQWLPTAARFIGENYLIYYSVCCSPNLNRCCFPPLVTTKREYRDGLN